MSTRSRKERKQKRKQGAAKKKQEAAKNELKGAAPLEGVGRPGFPRIGVPGPLFIGIPTNSRKAEGERAENEGAKNPNGNEFDFYIENSFSQQASFIDMMGADYIIAAIDSGVEIPVPTSNTNPTPESLKIMDPSSPITLLITAAMLVVVLYGARKYRAE